MRAVHRVGDGRVGSRGAILAGAIGCAISMALAAVGTSAHAADLAVCTGSETVRYSPGLTLVRRTVTATYEDFVSCVSSDPGASTATWRDTVPGEFSCLSLVSPFEADPFQVTVTWADGRTSVWNYEIVTISNAGGQTVFTGAGPILSGKFAGATATSVVADVAPSLLDCLGSGVTGSSGPVQFNVAGL